MSMLAEPRQRKTYNLVPRGKALYEDDCRFGTKMLKKMGWNKEKGLGANEDGTTEFVRVQYKNNVKGLGYEDRDDQWTQHEQSFSGLLQNLNGATKEAEKEDAPSDDDTPRIGFGFPAEQKQQAVKLSEKISGESLEEKSKRSKARVHYKKFTRGKDLTRYSEKDLANIFGKKAIEQSQENGVFGQLTAITVKRSDSESEEKEEKENFAGVQTINTGVSVGDYFKQKMEAIRNKMKSGADASIETEQEQPEVQNEVLEESLKRKPSLDLENDNDETQPKKKKKKKDKKEQFLENAEKQTIPAEDLSRESTSDSKNVKRKKEKKTSKKLTENEELPDAQEQNTVMEPKEELSSISSDSKNAKSKKEKKASRAETEDQELQETKCDSSKKNKAKKSSKSATEDVDINAIADSNPDESSKSIEEKSKTKKSSKQTNEKTIEKSDEVRINVENNRMEQNVVIDVKKKKNKSAPLKINENHVNMEDETLEDIINSEKQRKQKLDVSTLTVDDLRAKVKDCDVILISTYNAERFRNCQLDAFKCSNIANITGYSCTDDLQLNIQNIKGDEQRIMELWTGNLNKYADQIPKYCYKKYASSVFNARRAKMRKMPKLHVKTFKRMTVFQTI